MADSPSREDLEERGFERLTSAVDAGLVLSMLLIVLAFWLSFR